MKDINWVENELEGVAINDGRLVKRLIKTAKILSKFPACSIPEACNNWSETKATYRLLDNEKVSQTIIIESHRQETIKRINKLDKILIVQDTTFLDYSDHPATEGLGLYSTSDKSKGILNHTALALTPNGVPLGLLAQKFWTRDPEQKENEISDVIFQ